MELTNWMPANEFQKFKEKNGVAKTNNKRVCYRSFTQSGSKLCFFFQAYLHGQHIFV